jgi:lysophospholipase L1-like esterase
MALLAAALLAAPALASTLGVMGDSLSDEYAEASYGSYAENWVEQLVIHGGIDAGPTALQAGQSGGTWGEPRRTGYEYNWARAGANSDTLLSGGQHTGLAGLVTSEGIAYAVLAIGANDFHPQTAAYQSIYAGSWSSTQIDAYVNQLLDNIEDALDTVLPTGVRLVLVNVPDYGVTPTVQFYFPDPARRQLVSDVIQQVNSGIDAIAQARLLAVVDMFGATLAIFGPHGSPNAVLTLGNVAIDLLASDTASGGNPTAGFVHDGIHPNTTLQGIMANTLLEGLDIGYNANLPLFSEAEILAHRGLAYGGSDTLAAQLGEYGDYVTSYVSLCNNGSDDDGDGFADYPADPGCRDAASHVEAAACQDGNDNDGDGKIDFDGGQSIHGPCSGGTCPLGVSDPDMDGIADPDPQCVNSYKNREAPYRFCGLGIELALLLAPLLRLAARRGRWGGSGMRSIE